MAILGYYKVDNGKDKGPYVDGHIYFPRLDIAGWVEFLIDSGADLTMLQPGPDLEINIPYHRLRSNIIGRAVGIGGQQHCFIEPGLLSLVDDQYSYRRCFLNIFIADVSESSIFQESTSLLGREFLNLCDLRLNHPQNLVSLTPLNVDAGGIILPP